MKRKRGLLPGILALLLTGLVIAGCSNGGGGSTSNNNTGSNPFLGSWSGVFRFTVEGEDPEEEVATLNFTSSRWVMTFEDEEEGIGGTYTRSGNNATLNMEGVDTFTAEVSGDTLTLVTTDEFNNLMAETGGGNGSASATLTKQ